MAYGLIGRGNCVYFIWAVINENRKEWKSKIHFGKAVKNAWINFYLLIKKN